MHGADMFGALILFAFGVLLLRLSKGMHGWGEPDYSRYPVTVGTVLGTHSCSTVRWLVRFTDETGREVLGMDDIPAGSSLHPERYHIPKSSTEERIFYWKCNREKQRYSLNGVPVEYHIHFCDESLYGLSKEEIRKSSFRIRILGIGILTAGGLVLLKSLL